MPLGNVGSTKANKREIFERKISNRINTGATEKKRKMNSYYSGRKSMEELFCFNK